MRPLLAALLLASLAAAQPASPPQQLDIMFSAGLLPAVNRLDVVAAVRMLGASIARSRDLNAKPVSYVVDTVPEIRQRLKDGFSGVLVTDVVEAVQLANETSLEPIFNSVRNDGATSYLLVTRAGAGLDSLASLRNKRLLVNFHTSANLGLLWLDAHLLDNRLQLASQYFTSIDLVAKSSAAILPVFFRKADAAIVDQASFQDNVELNPSLGKDLHVLARSPALPEGIIFLSRNLANRDAVAASLRNLHQSADGRQVLTMFRIPHLAPLDPRRLEEVRQLYRKRQQAARPLRPLSPPPETPATIR